MPTTLLVISDPKAKHLKALERLPAEVDVLVTNDADEILAHAAETDCVLNAAFKGDLIASVLARSPRVRWVHTLFTGVESILTPDVVASAIPLTNGRGVFRVPLAEWTIGAMLSFAYSFRRLIRQQQESSWKPFQTETLHGATLGIVGYGGIGSATAERAKALGMRVLALRRRAELTSDDPRVDRFYPRNELDALVAASDYVQLATPLTPETRGLFGEAQIAAMKPNGVLVNVGRGAVVDEPALVRALQSGKIRGAALDVFAAEPLPAEHAFWSMENVLLSPHCADQVRDFLDLGYEAFFENLERFREGKPLEYVVDKRAGY